MRLWPLLFFAFAGTLSAGEGSPDPTFPLWDGQESVAQYALRVNLPPTETLDLGNGVKLELVLIPAGKFIMGTPEPVEVDEYGFRKQIVAGQALLAAGVGVLLVLLGSIIVQAIRRRRRPQFSLARLLAMALAMGVAVLSGMHWWHTTQALWKAMVENQAALARYIAASPEEKPAHPVTISRPFYMGKFAVTQEQYQQMIGENPSQVKGKYHPVDNVPWEDAQEFCKRLSGHAKQAVLLPTEAEWEYSCRAGTRTTYYSGDTDKDLDGVAWYEANSISTAHPVGQKGPNAFGLFDMHGNSLTWCQDWHEGDYYSNSPDEDPQGPAQGACRVVRGGSWRLSPERCRSADRAGSHYHSRFDYVGIRVVMSASRTP